jgi:2-dehydropantoate 2-reductase
VNIVVIGPGAIGLLCAIRLAHAGQPVTLLARPATAAQLAGQPLSLRQADERMHTMAVTLADDPAAVAQQTALAVVCVKGYDTPGIIPALQLMRPAHILTLQNGIGNEETLAAQFGAERVISGAITTSVEVEAPGQISVAKSGGIGLAPMTASTDVQQWANIFSSAGFRVQTYADYRAMKWSKALLNMLGNATAAILDMSVQDVYADRRLVALEQRAFLEALHTMQRLGCRPINLPRYPAAILARAMQYLPAPLLYPVLRRVIAGGRGGKPPSLQLDLMRGNTRSEGAFLYGAVAETAARVGVPAPVNRALWSTLQSIVRGEVPWDTFRKQPDALLAAVQRSTQHAQTAKRGTS